MLLNSADTSQNCWIEAEQGKVSMLLSVRGEGWGYYRILEGVAAAMVIAIRPLIPM